MVTDIVNNGFKVTSIALEIGSRDFISHELKLTALEVFPISFFFYTSPLTFEEVRNILSKNAVTSSFALYCAKNESTWGYHCLLES